MPTDSQDILADKIVAAISAVGLNLDPVKTTGPARIHLGAGTNLTLDTTLTHLTQTGDSGVLDDGSVFVIGNGTKSVPYEFDYNGIFDAFNNTILHVSPSSTLPFISWLW